MATLLVSAPFNDAFISAAKNLGGTWDRTAKRWEFAAAVEADLRDALRAVYGNDGTAAETVTVRVVVPQMERGQRRDEVVVGGVVAAKRWDRDEPVRLMNGARLVSGEFTPKGRSKAAPGTAVKGSEPVVLEVPGVFASAVTEGPDLRVVSHDGEATGPVTVTVINGETTKECLSCGSHVTRREVRQRGGDWNAHGSFCECGC